jgi:multidrug efflux pump subunit AcrA (membrane-fusion protein)
MQERAGGRDMESLSQEERRKLFQQVRAQMGGGGSAGSRRGGERGGQGAARGAAGGGQGQSQEALFLPTASQQFSAEDRDNARLPASAREGSDVEVLLRPGLLADAEVIIDRIPNALHIPVQAVFEGRTGSVVYVPNGKRLEARKVELGKRTESRVEILSGLEEGEIISLERPADQQGGRKTKKKKGAETSAFPGSGGPGAGSSGRGGRGGAGGGGRSRGGGRTR